MARFDEVMETVFKWEGGYVDNPFDNGGPTNMGITHKVLAQWRGVAAVTKGEVQNLTRAEATLIFEERYWKPIRGKALPAPIDLIVMDGAVNHGVSGMARILQRCVGVEVDGKIGKITIGAVGQRTSSRAAILDLAIALAEARKSLYLGHEDARVFLNGWRNRLNDVMAVALAGGTTAWTFDAGRSNRTSAADRPAPTEALPATSWARPAIDDVDLQAMLMTVGLYRGPLDGEFGSASAAALEGYLTRTSAAISGDWRAWGLERRKIALGQLLCLDVGIDPGRIDGLVGPSTTAAFEEFNRKKLRLPPNRWRDEIDALPPTGVSTASTVWPMEADVPAFFGALGEGCTLVPLKRLALPYKMRLAWDLGVEIDGIRLHEKVYDSAGRVFDRFYSHYGDSGIVDLGLDLFGGTTSCRKKRGGTSWSMHAWSIAIDFDPARNQLAWNHTQARLAKPDAVRFWEFWEAEGWVGLGRAKDFDWMHVQAARV